MSLRVAILNYAYEEKLDVEALLARYFLLTGWAEGLCAAGAHVSVLQRYKRNVDFERNGVAYHFVADGSGGNPSHLTIPITLHRHPALAPADVAHLNGLIFPLQTMALRLALPRACPIVAQHHGELPRTGWRGWLQTRGLRCVDGVLFTADGIAQEWRACGIIQAQQPTYEVLEGSSPFRPGDKLRARSQTGLAGNPVILWVGRLDENKDPLTVLAGFEQALAHAPNMRLVMAHRGDDLLREVRNRIGRSAALQDAVSLLGHVPHNQMERLYQSADYFVLGSHHEAAGISLVEALACGVVPVVTNIPAFCKLTKDGALGALWKPSDASDFARALLEVQRQPHVKLSVAVADHFASELSFEAIGRRALRAYKAILSCKT